MIPEYLKQCNDEVVAIGDKPHLIRVDFLPFPEWPASVKYSFAKAMEADKKAMLALELLGITDKDEQIEKFAFCKNGGFDDKADFTADGKHHPEYFDCPLRENCNPQAQRHLCGAIKVENGYLFPAEIRVIKLIAQDLADKEIADKLNIKYSTATKHRSNILKKIGAAGKPGIAIFAIQNGIL